MKSARERPASATASAGARPVEGRLVGVPYRPYRRPPAPAPTASGDIPEPVVRRLQSEVERGASPAETSQLAAAWLTIGRPEDAIDRLEQALAGDGGDPRLENQLAVAYLERASRLAQPIDLPRALGAAERALRAGPALPEARFNRALILERLMLRDAARRAWQEVAAAEPDPGWRQEAEAYLATLSIVTAEESWAADRRRLERAASAGDEAALAAVVERWPEPARLLAEEELLPRWGMDTLAGRTESAERALALARAIGAALQRSGGDLMLFDSVGLIYRVAAAGDGERRRHLLAGHAAYGRGVSLYRRRNVDAAEVELRRAGADLGSVGSPFAYWARHYLAGTRYHRQQLEATTAALHEIRAQIPARRYPALRVRMHLLQASMAILQGRPGESFADLRAAAAICRATDAFESLSAVHEHFATALGALGDTDAAWRHLHAGLALAPRVVNPMRTLALLDEAGFSAMQLSWPEAALAIREELLAVSHRIGTPEVIAVATLRRADTLAHLGRIDEARRDFVAAREQTPRILNPTLRARDEAEIDLAQAELELPTDPEAAAARTTRAVEFFGASHYDFFLPLAYALRARARLALGDETAALADYFASLTVLETTRGTAPDRRLQIALFDQFSALFDEVLGVLAQHENQPGASFAVAERGRGRDLFEQLSRGAAVAAPPRSRLSMAEIRRRLPPGTLLIRCAVLPDRLLVWWLRREDGGLVQVATTAQEVERQVSAARRDLQSHRDGRPVPALRSLYRTLLTPVAAVVRSAGPIVFVPDKELHLLPFAALVDPVTGRYLIEDHVVGIAPSANVFVRSLERQGELPRQPPESIVAIAATDFDRGRFPSLARLPGAEGEIGAIAALYPSARQLDGRDATRQALSATLAERPEVIHLAGHSVVNPGRPDLSMLLLAPDAAAGDSGVVYSHEMDGWSLPGTRLAVLSACETAYGLLSPSEGAMSLARPLLAAGVPAVVGSLWRVDDEATAGLMIRFHRRIRAGDDPQTALRAAQLAQLHAGGDAAAPGMWAPFQVIGGGSPVPGEDSR